MEVIYEQAGLVRLNWTELSWTEAHCELSCITPPQN